MSDWIHDLDHKWPHQWRSDKLLGIAEIYKMLDWCDQHCCDEMISSPDEQVWYFKDKNDCLLFTLQWSDK